MDLPGHQQLRTVVQVPAGTTSSPASRALYGEWLLATHKVFLSSVTRKDLGMAWLRFLCKEFPVLYGASFGLSHKQGTAQACTVTFSSMQVAFSELPQVLEAVFA